MKRFVLGLIFIFFVAGCGTVSSTDGSQSFSTWDEYMAHNRQNIARLEYGMTKAQVQETMGTASIKSYTNPFSSSLYRDDNGDIVEVLSYWTDSPGQWKNISDDELTPVVLMNGKVIGWGRTFFGDYVQKLEIKIR